VIRVPPVPEPDGFDEARSKGNRWLESNRAGSPPSLWSAFRDDLEHGFRSRCGYAAMYTPGGQVDHYRCQRDYRALIYEWTNYRYVSGTINSRKKALDVLDPYEVDPSWFEILHPSLQLVLTSAVPDEERARAERTIIKLGLRDGEFVLKMRRQWLQMYLESKVNLAGLRDLAPLLADMIERHEVSPDPRS